MNRGAVQQKDLVLVGGGHAHVQLLKMFAMQPEPGLRLTIVSDVFFAPYSGMLPGYLAGIYSWHDVHFDLARISAKAGARFISGTAVEVDPLARSVRLAGGGTLFYDLLSINIGSVPTVPDHIDSGRVLAVKPISLFLTRWQALLQQIDGSTVEPKLAVVGGGAAGFELALILQRHVRRKFPAGKVRLFQAETRLLASHPERLSRILESEAQQAGLALHLGQRVSSFQDGRIRTESGEEYACDQSVWATQASATALFRNSGLPTDERGFLRVDSNLQVAGHEGIFGAGDCIAFPKPLPKSGVFAVREAGTLAANVRRLIRGEALQPYRPQAEQLALITAGSKVAYASRGIYLGSGTLWWQIKDHIDRKFMQRWQDYSGMPVSSGTMAAPESDHTVNTCGGCGSKVGPASLRTVLSRIGQTESGTLQVGLEERDDAVVTRPLTGEQIVESVDLFRSFISDPFLTGRIAALHALSDLYAMGATPFSAQILLQLPDMPAALVERDMQLVLEGAVSALRADWTALTGGHTSTGPELQVGFAVLGSLDPGKSPLRKTGSRPGDVLILTKPLGTGACLRAHMAGALRGDHLQVVLAGMAQSNRIILELTKTMEVHAATDVTGFGLAGHLLEMFPGRDISTMIERECIPAYEGFETACDNGHETLLAGKIRMHAGQLAGVNVSAWPRLWFDPQTGGGLLISISPADGDKALALLQAAGFTAAAVIGQVSP
jgi:selenide,water dikinase